MAERSQERSRGSESSQRMESRSESGRSSSRRQSASGADDLKRREYRDEKGQIHHHTRTSRAMRERESS